MVTAAWDRRSAPRARGIKVAMATIHQGSDAAPSACEEEDPAAAETTIPLATPMRMRHAPSPERTALLVRRPSRPARARSSNSGGSGVGGGGIEETPSRLAASTSPGERSGVRIPTRSDVCAGRRQFTVLLLRQWRR